VATLSDRMMELVDRYTRDEIDVEAYYREMEVLAREAIREEIAATAYRRGVNARSA
jgi:ribosomal protein S24E